MIANCSDEEKQLIVRYVSYDPESGKLFRKEQLPGGRGAKPAGTEIIPCAANGGHLYVQPIGAGKKYYVHRIAWLLTHGEWPEAQIDHIDHNPANNRLSNLRPATQTDNNRNITMSKRNKSGVTGVSWNAKRSCWVAQASLGGKKAKSSYHKDLISAVAARYAASRELNYHENHGKRRSGQP